MGHRRVVNNYYSDINNLSELLAKLSSSYRLLIGGAGELNVIALAKKNEVKNAIDRADDLGKVIDKVIKVLDEATSDYSEYCKLKSSIVKSNIDLDYIKSEIEEELKQND